MNGIVFPIIVLAVLTAGVYLRLVGLRVTILRDKEPSPTLKEKEQQANNNIKNLFEMPVLFYLVCILYLFLNLGGTLVISLAWVYVGLRVLHSIVHCSHNQLRYRLALFIASAVILLGMWGILIGELIR